VRSDDEDERRIARLVGADAPPVPCATIVVPHAYVAFVRVVEALHPPRRPAAGTHPTAVIASNATIAPGAAIGPWVVVGERVRIGRDAALHAGVVIYDDVTIGDATVIPNPFWGGLLFPLVVFAVLAMWPWIERRVTGDRAHHNLLDRPRDVPFRTAFGLGFLTWVVLVFFAGSSDRLFVFLGVGYTAQIWFWRFAIWILPVIVALVAARACRALQAAEQVEQIRERAEAETIAR